MKSLEEVFWIEQVKSGNVDYFSKLYDKYQRRLFTLCVRLTGNHADAEEQLQEIFLLILKKIDSFQYRSSFSTWVFRLAMNHLKNFQNRKAEEVLPYQEPSFEHAHVNDIVNSQLSRVLTKYLSELPMGFRQVIVLHDQLGMKHTEIAEILDIKAASSRSQLCRARMILRDKIVRKIEEVAL